MSERKRKPSKVAAEAIREMSSELDEQRALLEQIKGLIIDLSAALKDHRVHVTQAISDLGARVKELEGARKLQ